MDKIKHIFCESTNISNVPIVDGQIIAFTDQIGWAYDVSSTRYTVSGGAIINDNTVSVNQTWSSSKSRTEIDAVRGGSAFCPTASSVAAKEAICVGYTATADTYLPIVLVNANGANSALTLSVNGGTAKPIYIDGAPSSSDNKVLPAGSYIIYYDGTNYYFRTDGKLTGAGLVDVDGNTDKFLRGDGTWQPVRSTYDDSALVNNTPWYGTSSTGATTQAKVATTSARKLGTLRAGQKAKIKFTYTNTHATPTLNVDGKGAKSIKAYGSTAPNMWWKAGDVVEFTYDGTNWVMGPTSGQISDLKSGIGFVGTTAEITAAINNGTITEGMLVYNTEESSEPATRGNAPFVNCSTARNIVAKTVTVDQFNLAKGALVTVKFTDVTTTDPLQGNLTLNVSGTGAKPIADEHSNALTYKSASYFCDNRVCEFQYDGTNWVWLNSDLELHAAVTQLNNDLGDIMFRNNSGTAQYSMDDGTTWVNFKNPTGTKSITANGTYDVTDYASANVNVPASEVTLWTNSSPSTNFNSQTINVSGGTSTYKAFCIYWNYKHTNSTYKSSSKTYNLSSGAQASGCVNGGISNAFTFRNCTISSISSSSTTFNFGNGFAIENGTLGSNNSFCIPTKITGIK